MDFSNLIRKGPAEWILPVDGHQPILFIGTEEIIRNLDAKCVEQAINGSRVHGVERIIVNPDAHAGYGVPVGSVVVSNNVVLPGPVGPDISCSMSYLQLDLPADEVQSREARRRIIDEIVLRIPTGAGKRQAPKGPRLDQRDDGLAVCYSAAVCGAINTDTLDRLGIPTEWVARLEQATNGRLNDLDDRMDLLKERYDKCNWDAKLLQLGSYGSGNHFGECEITHVQPGQELVAETFKLKDGCVGFLSHCGSRGFGYNLAANHFKSLAAHFQQWGIPLSGGDKELVYAPADSDAGRAYLADMALGANFAVVNHLLINKLVLDAFKEVFPGVKGELVYHVAHNIGREEIVDGSKRFVWRKGATRAFPAGHHALATTPFYQTGHPVLLPGNPEAGSWIMRGLPGAEKTAYSINHGAGRAMGRKEACRRMTQEQVNKVMDDADLLSNCRNYPVDEAPAAYKGFDEVMESVKQAGLAEPVAKLQARFVIKDNDKDREGAA